MKQILSKANRIQTLTLLSVYINVFMTGCTYGWTANAILFFQRGNEVKATPSEWSLFASSTDLGRLMLAIPSGILVDKFGRKKSTIGAGMLNIICWTLLSITSSTSAIIFARFLLGVAMAIVNATASITIGEVASRTIRAKFIGIYHIFLSSGKLFQAIISIWFSSYFVLSYCSLAISCTFFISLFWILETPHYLISVSRIEEARTILEYIRPEETEEGIDFEFSGMQTYILDEKKKQQLINWIQFLKSKSIRKPLITGISISFFALATGLGLIGSFITVIIPENNAIPSEYYPLILQIAPFMVSFITPLYAEKLSRRTLYLLGAVLVFSTNIILALSDYFYTEIHNDAWKWIFFFVIFLQIMISNGSVQPMNNTMKSELFPQSVKGLGASFCVIFQSLANIILYESYNLVTTKFGQYCVFIILAANSLILCLLIYFRLPEARGQYLADLQTCSDETITTSVKAQTSYGTVDN